MKKTRGFLLAAGILLALAFTFSCSGDDGEPSGGNTPGGGKGNNIGDYETVKIGTQTWMAENLNYAAEGSKCYNDVPANCDKYGRLYNWNTVRDFRKEYGRIADKWAADDKGFAEKRTGRSYDAWRSKVIYSTNMATAYAAGREAQMHDPAMKGIWTHARYRCMMDGREREEHAMWNDTVLPIDDPWWSAHTPPNGWNCRCWKEPVSEAEMGILKKEGARLKERRPTSPDSTRGIDEGWSHNAGEADAGSELLKQAYRQPRYSAEEQQGLWSGTPEPMRLEAVNRKELYSTPGPMESKGAFETALKEALKTGETGFKQFEIKKAGFTYAYAVDAKYLANHLGTDRSKFAGMIAETIKDPQEVRAVFLRSDTGKVAIRHYFYSKFKDADGSEKYVKVVFDANQARFVSYTAFPNRADFKPEGTAIYRKG